ncbi:Protein F37C4.5 [Hypsizygus marmoreus]|uniref:Protein F37C4.5 n=1 Tax=Hypsizygus marmoreus TaxID=39966 RepID=A0A369IZS3_HYPMA|nr:Protein F37C4.5 [Hypsizygus marmoreus]
MTTSSTHTPTSNAIELIPAEHSTILGVTVYPGRAEITRLFKFKTHTGQNQVIVNNLPNVLDRNSLRVEGRGDAVIHGVTVSNMTRSTPSSTSPALAALLLKKKKTLKALERCKKSLASLEAYLATVHVQHVDMSHLEKIVDDYDSVGAKLDNRVLELEQELVDIEADVDAERMKLTGQPQSQDLNIQASIDVFSEAGGDIELTLRYAVQAASWHATYDIRVDMHAENDPVTLVYKAAITQSTGEDWTDIPLTLDTITPTFGVGVPNLEPWNLSLHRNVPLYSYASAPPGASIVVDQLAPPGTPPGAPPPAPAPMAQAAPVLMPAIAHRELTISSMGNVSATFQVPGTITIPSDGVAHAVTIAQLDLSAAMSWLSVPKKDPRVHLNAKINNASQYTFLRGESSVYVDGSFISRSKVPAVSPGESFNCSLGVDPSIRITYHQRTIKASRKGFYSKSNNKMYSQQITIFNTKVTPVSDIKVMDQFPISEDSRIQVKRINPALALPEETDGSPMPTHISHGVIAQWDGADEADVDQASFGRNGKFNWVCSLPPQGKIILQLEWEVSAPINENVYGQDPGDLDPSTFPNIGDAYSHHYTRNRYI